MKAEPEEMASGQWGYRQADAKGYGKGIHGQGQGDTEQGDEVHGVPSVKSPLMTFCEIIKGGFCLFFGRCTSPGDLLSMLKHPC